MRILILGGTGQVGSAAVRALRDAGESVRVMSHRPAAVRVPDGVELVAGDLEDRASLDPAFSGIDRAALVPPLHPREGSVLINGLEAAAQARVERFVLLTVHHLDEMPDAVHLTGKREAEAEALRLGLPVVFLRPNNYFQNDLAVAPTIRQGFYPVPLGPVGCNSIDTRDVGEALARLLVGEGREGERVAVVGARRVTGEGAAELWSRSLGRDVRYAGGDLDAWAAQSRAHLPDWLVDALAAMYRHVALHGMTASGEEIAATAALLGRPARSYEDFVAENAGV